MLPGLAPSIVMRKPGIIRLGGAFVPAPTSATTFTFPVFNVPFDGRLILITQATGTAARTQTASTINGAATVVHSQAYNSEWIPVTIASLAVTAGRKTHSVSYNATMQHGVAYAAWLLPGSATTAPSAMANSGSAGAAASRALTINTPAKGVVTAFAFSAWPSNPFRWTGATASFYGTNTPIEQSTGPAMAGADYTATVAETAHAITTTYDVSTAGTMVAASWVL